MEHCSARSRGYSDACSWAQCVILRYSHVALRCDVNPSPCTNIFEHMGPSSLIHIYSTLSHDVLSTPRVSLYVTCVSVAFTLSYATPSLGNPRRKHSTSSRQISLSTSITDAANVSVMHLTIDEPVCGSGEDRLSSRMIVTQVVGDQKTSYCIGVGWSLSSANDFASCHAGLSEAITKVL